MLSHFSPLTLTSLTLCISSSVKPSRVGLLSRGAVLPYNRSIAKAPFFHPDQLNRIRRSADWQRLFQVLGIEKDENHSTERDWWGKSPFRPDERTASFHINEKGWYCWATDATAPGCKKPGGGPIELVQAIHATRGQIMKINEAAQWLLDHGVAFLGESPTRSEEPAPAPAATERPRAVNAPIRTDLVPRLAQLGTHPEFVRRGIGADTCRYLRCGFLENGKTPLAGRVVFQIGGIEEQADGSLKRVILSHMGRAVSEAQADAHGKWWMYKGFNKTLEIYNLDNLLTDPLAAEQARATGHVLLVEGPYDVAKLVEAGVRNVAATMGAHLASDQLPRLGLIVRRLGVTRFRLWYDRDAAGGKGVKDALELLAEHGMQADAFDWGMGFPSRSRGCVTLPDTLTDPCDLSSEQIRWLREKGVI